MKRKNEKKNFKNNLHKMAIKIKCQYCDVREACIKRQNKEKDEQNGVMTYCIITPNKPKSYSKKNKKSK